MATAGTLHAAGIGPSLPPMNLNVQVVPLPAAAPVSMAMQPQVPLGSARPADLRLNADVGGSTQWASRSRHASARTGTSRSYSSRTSGDKNTGSSPSLNRHSRRLSSVAAAYVELFHGSESPRVPQALQNSNPQQGSLLPSPSLTPKTCSHIASGSISFSSSLAVPWKNFMRLS
jgi:hypothetical protein